jgi:hypothetical protein
MVGKEKNKKKKEEKINPLSLEEFHFQMYENSKHIWSNGNGP